jgi:hypothetical protein
MLCSLHTVTLRKLKDCSKIWGFHTTTTENTSGLHRCDAVCLGKQFQMCHRIVVPSGSSRVKKNSSWAAWHWRWHKCVQYYISVTCCHVLLLYKTCRHSHWTNVLVERSYYSEDMSDCHALNSQYCMESKHSLLFDILLTVYHSVSQ